MNTAKARFLSAALAFAAAVFPVGAEETKNFCTMNQAVDQLFAASGVPEDIRKMDVPKMMAEDLVREKLKETPGEPIAITWKDVYDMRGTLNAWLCDQGRKMNCVGSAVDAVGAGLTGTGPGKVLMNTGLALAGPPGFVLLSGMNITQETFQCSPSAIKMSVEAGASVVMMMPWCKAPGIDKACIAAQNSLKKGASIAAKKMFGMKVTASSARQVQGGVEVTLIKDAEAAAAPAPKRLPSADKISSLWKVDSGPVPGRQQAGAVRLNPGAGTSVKQPARQLAATQVRQGAETAPALFSEALKGTKMGSVIKPESGVFYRGVTAKELERITDSGAIVPRAFHKDYRGTGFEDYIKKRGADSMVYSHTQGGTQYLTSLTSDIKVAEIYGTSKGALLRVTVNDGRAYSTNAFSNFGSNAPGIKLPESEFVVPGKIDAKFVEIFDKASGKWVPLRDYIAKHPAK